MRWGSYLLLVGAWSLPALVAAAQPGSAFDSSTNPRSRFGGDGTARGLVDRLTGPRLARELESPSVSVRMRAAVALGRVGAPGPAVDVLIDSLVHEPTGPVRAAIARALVRRGDPRAIAVLIEAFQSSGSADGEALAEALGAFATGEAIEALIAATRDPRMRQPATEALVRAGPRVVPYLVDRLRDAEAPLPIIEALGEIGSPLATAALLDQLASPQPLVRVAALRGLEHIGDPRAARGVLAALTNDSAVVQRAAISALGTVGAPNDAARLEPLLTGTLISDLGVWEAILALDPARAVAGLLGAVPPGEEPPPGLVRLVLAHLRPSLLPLFERWAALPGFATGPYGAELLEALGAIPDEGALRLLTRLAADHPELVERSAVELALALFRFGPHFSGEAREAALSIVARVESTVDRLILRALARDPSVTDDLEAALEGDEHDLRWAAAFVLATSDGPCPTEALRVAGREADDPELFRRVAEASLRCGVKAAPSVYAAFLHDPETAPEAMVWAAFSLRGVSRHARDELGRSLRIALHRGAARGRAGAARALAELGDREAYRALLGALEDGEPSVRRAAARALEVLAVPEAMATIEAIARIEADPFLRAAMIDAARAGDPLGTRHRALRFARRGVEVYRAPPLDAPGDATATIDLMLPDGTQRRFAASPSGRLLIAGLPYGPVQARVQVWAAGAPASP